MPGLPEARADTSVLAKKASTGHLSGQRWARRAAGSRRRHSQSAVSAMSAP